MSRSRRFGSMEYHSSCWRPWHWGGLCQGCALPPFLVVTFTGMVWKFTGASRGAAGGRLLLADVVLLAGLRHSPEQFTGQTWSSWDEHISIWICSQGCGSFQGGLVWISWDSYAQVMEVWIVRLATGSDRRLQSWQRTVVARSWAVKLSVQPSVSILTFGHDWKNEVLDTSSRMCFLFRMAGNTLLDSHSQPSGRLSKTLLLDIEQPSEVVQASEDVAPPSPPSHSTERRPQDRSRTHWRDPISGLVWFGLWSPRATRRAVGSSKEQGCLSFESGWMNLSTSALWLQDAPPFTVQTSSLETTTRQVWRIRLCASVAWCCVCSDCSMVKRRSCSRCWQPSQQIFQFWGYVSRVFYATVEVVAGSSSAANSNIVLD